MRSSFILEKRDKVSATTFSEVEMWEVRRPTGFRIRRVACRRPRARPANETREPFWAQASLDELSVRMRTTGWGSAPRSGGRRVME